MNCTFQSRSGKRTFDVELHLYPEPNGISCIQECPSDKPEDQLWHWVRWIETHDESYLDNNAVPITRYVDSLDDGFVVEAAPKLLAPNHWPSANDHLREDFLDRLSWPVNSRTGKRVDWMRMPVKWSRFPGIGRAIGWKPSPMQPFMPLNSILSSRHIAGIGDQY